MWNLQASVLRVSGGSSGSKNFLWHTWTDQSVPVENSLLLLQALRKAGVNVEAHLYPVGPHGIALWNRRNPGNRSEISGALL